MSDEQLREQVRALREGGWDPKAIARALSVRPAQVKPLVRSIAQERHADAGDPRVVGCWVSPGWSAGLMVDTARRWPDHPGPAADSFGLAAALVARARPRGRDGVTVCGYLVDTFCLGVKDALGPETMSRSELRRFSSRFFDAFAGDPVDAPVELARHLVWGAVEYARGLGFEPAGDFAPTVEHLGPLVGPSAIGFGRDGTPCYMQGPFDDADRIMRTLRLRAGEDGLDYTVAHRLQAV